MNAITTFLDSLEAAEPVHAGGLTMVPLLARAEIEPAYLTLDQGLAGGTVRVQEVSEQGSVPELLFLNEGGRCVLVLDGEELIGAKQNRIAQPADPARVLRGSGAVAPPQPGVHHRAPGLLLQRPGPEEPLGQRRLSRVPATPIGSGRDLGRHRP
jgi:hypothetical protein